MFFKRIETEGLAHWSYMIGDRDAIAVIDPRRDVGIYLEEARRAKKKITFILETHRNEDYIIGSRELADLTGATVLISGHDDLAYSYGTRILDQESIKLGKITIKAIHTPGHTLGHMCYAAYLNNGTQPYMLFTGDTLFAGDVGRTDFYGKDRLAEMTGLLYDSITQKLFPLGDHVILCPSHGAGSACGSGIEDRQWTTLGYERMFNPKLQHATRESFTLNLGKVLPKPPYFSKMEKCNLLGAPYMGGLNTLSPTGINELRSIIAKQPAEPGPGPAIIDVREEAAFCASHIPNSLYISKNSLASYLGWFVDVESPLYFITNDYSEASLTSFYMTCQRMGFENVRGFLSVGMLGWESKGREINSIQTISSKEFDERLSGPRELTVLDVRKAEELEITRGYKGSLHIPLHELKEKAHRLPDKLPIYLLCETGNRSTIAASILKQQHKEPLVVLGGIKGWKAYQSFKSSPSLPNKLNVVRIL